MRKPDPRANPLRILSCLMLFVTLAALPAQAQQRVIMVEDQPSWNAVGRLNRGGVSSLKTCTATLVAPTLVLTAEHCVPHPNAGAERISGIIFVAGWNRGDYAAQSPAAAIEVHPDHQPGPLSVNGVASDVALVTLANPILNITPMPLWTDALPERVGFVAYANSRLHAPAISSDCFNVSRAESVRYLACGVESGNSGAPMLAGLPDDPHVAGIVSARFRLGALAATLDDWVIEKVSQALQDETSK